MEFKVKKGFALRLCICSAVFAVSFANSALAFDPPSADDPDCVGLKSVKQFVQKYQMTEPVIEGTKLSTPDIAKKEKSAINPPIQKRTDELLHQSPNFVDMVQTDGKTVFIQLNF